MDLNQILDFLHFSEGLKKELRHSWLSNGRQESVAEHTWRMMLMAILLESKIDSKLDLLKVLKMIIIHDIAEITVGDSVPYEKQKHEMHKKLEEQEMSRLKEKFKSNVMGEIYDLWIEYSKGETLEAEFAKALDKLEVRLQHNEAEMSSWNDIEFIRSQYAADKYCEFDNIINEFNIMVKEESAKKITKESTKDIKGIQEKAAVLKIQEATS
jgi:putative hydrolases of HD superfamily